jgi:hypothetical protein
MECDDGEIVFRDAGKMGLEGIVSKPKDSATVPADHPAGRQHTASSSSS